MRVCKNETRAAFVFCGTLLNDRKAASYKSVVTEHIYYIIHCKVLQEHSNLFVIFI